MESNKRLFRSEIFCLGNELLIGRTVNKNATEIALVLSKLGFKVERETTVRDELTKASEALIEILHRKPDVVILTGGLGPTHDDIQAYVIGEAVNSELELNQKAVDMMSHRYKIQKDDITASMLKMATIPKNATPLRNSQGAAPGIQLKYENTWIFGLPGVPSEMRAILEEEIYPFLKIQFPLQKLIEFGFSIHGAGESRIIPVTNRVMEEFPNVGFKSHPKSDENGYWLDLHTYAIGVSSDEVKKACQRWYNELSNDLDVKLSSIKPIFDDTFVPE